MPILIGLLGCAAGIFIALEYTEPFMILVTIDLLYMGIFLGAAALGLLFAIHSWKIPITSGIMLIIAALAGGSILMVGKPTDLAMPVLFLIGGIYSIARKKR